MIQTYAIGTLAVMLAATGWALKYQYDRAQSLQLALDVAEKRVTRCVARAESISSACEADIANAATTAQRASQAASNEASKSIELCQAQVEHYKKNEKALSTRDNGPLPCAVRIDSGGLLSNIAKASRQATGDTVPSGGEAAGIDQRTSVAPR